MMTTHGLPSWLQKELDHFGLLSGSYADDEDDMTLEDYRAPNEPVGWTPSYLGEEPPF